MSPITYSLKSIHRILEKQKPSKVCVVTSQRLVSQLKWALKEIESPRSHIVVISDGEKAKEWKQLEILLKKFSKLNLDRTSIVIALGGGTIGDAVGFATSIYLRGIKYIQAPTTLLAQVDSAHGGKTGVNFLHLKNQIGSFHLPVATIVDTRFLNTLMREQIIDGLGEIIKAGFIKDPSILSLLRKHELTSLLQSSDLKSIISKSIEVKEYFINKDFNDTGLRQILNVGHTIGHSLELKYKISHGRAVILGMLQELQITESLGLTHPSASKNLNTLLAGLGIEVEENLEANWKTILHDKKIVGDTIVLPVIKREGKAKLVTLSLQEFKKAYSK